MPIMPRIFGRLCQCLDERNLVLSCTIRNFIRGRLLTFVPTVDPRDEEVVAGACHDRARAWEQ